MELNISVDDVKLTDYVGGDDDHGGITLGDLIADKLVHRLASTDEYRTIRRRVAELRDQQIREAIAPAIADALNAPIRQTNTWGEAIGGNTTLREHIVAIATKYINAPASDHDRKKGTRLEVLVREQVDAAFKVEIVEAVKAAREAVTGQLGTLVADAVRDTLRTSAMQAR